MTTPDTKTSHPIRNTYLLMLTTLSVGVLTGCEYCEPLLFASLIGGAVFGLLSAESALWHKTLRDISR